LITGQSGTGKELIAQLIHNFSKRKSAPFIKINCAAMSQSLLESELFGHEKGAFTGASAMHRGRFERAHAGTLMLDEITETSPAFQAKLLRVLEEMDFERVGGTERININVRVISTTNRDITDYIKQGKFREDLYYRLNGLTLSVPPLCERKSDLGDLVWHFVNEFSAEAGRAIKQIDPAMLDELYNYSWPGNIRELRNVIRTAMILGSSTTLSMPPVRHLRQSMLNDSNMDDSELLELAGINLGQLEQQAILATLKKHQGNQTRAAKVLGISDRTLRDKIKKYKQQGQLEEMLQ
jgi:transcriptional regulator with PAS, ATPase and Fis domain